MTAEAGTPEAEAPEAVTPEAVTAVPTVPGEPTTARAGRRSPPRPGRRFLLVLGLVVVAAAGVRAVNVLVWRPTCTEDFLAVVATAQAGGEVERPGPGCYQVVNDALYHHMQGRLLAEGHGFVDGATWFFESLAGDDARMRASAGDPPLYASFLAALSVLGFETVTGQRLATGVAGALGVGIIGLVGRRVAGERAGLLAAALGAIYPMLWINDGMLLSEGLYAPLCAGVVLAAYRWWDRPDLGRAAVLGLLLGLASLTRAEALALVVLLLVPLGWGLRRRVGTRRAAGGVALAGGVAVLSIVPWLAYNLGRFEEPVFMTSGTGSVLSAGACDATFGGPLLGYYANCFDQYVADGTVEGWPDPVTLDEAQRDAVSRDGAVRYLRDHLDELPRVVPARIGRMWDLYRPVQNVDLNWQIEDRDRWASEAGFAMYALLAPFAIGGAVVLWRRRLPISPLLAFPAAVTLTAAATFGVTRYRVPGDVSLVILAAVSIEALLRRGVGPSTTGLTTRRGDREVVG
jgi:hypothetical protein